MVRPVMPGERPFNRTDLHLAVLANNSDAVREALTAGADINAAEARSFTALHFAVNEGFVGVTRTLLEAGADVEVRTDIGRTPLHIAAIRWRKCPDGALISLLKSYGASSSAVDSKGSSVTDVASNLFGFPAELMALISA